MKARYEFVFLVKPGLKGERQKKVLAEILSQLKKIGGKVVEKEKWGERALAYPIQKAKKAIYFIWQIEFSKNKRVDFSPLLVYLNRSKEVLRYLFLRQGKRR